VKIRHILLALLALLAIAFMQPLVTFLGGLTLLIGAGAWIFRDLSPASQDAVERRVLSWLRRVRTHGTPEIERPPVRRRRISTLSREPGAPLTPTPAPNSASSRGDSAV
jgi:hypothetical protein